MAEWGTEQKSRLPESNVAMATIPERGRGGVGRGVEASEGELKPSLAISFHSKVRQTVNNTRRETQNLSITKQSLHFAHLICLWHNCHLQKEYRTYWWENGRVPENNLSISLSGENKWNEWDKIYVKTRWIQLVLIYVAKLWYSSGVKALGQGKLEGFSSHSQCVHWVGQVGIICSSRVHTIEVGITLLRHSCAIGKGK